MSSETPMANWTLAPEAEVPDQTTSWIVRPPDDAGGGRRTIEPGRSLVDRRLRSVTPIATSSEDEAPIARLRLVRARRGNLRSTTETR